MYHLEQRLGLLLKSALSSTPAICKLHGATEHSKCGWFDEETEFLIFFNFNLFTFKEPQVAEGNHTTWHHGPEMILEIQRQCAHVKPWIWIGKGQGNVS